MSKIQNRSIVIVHTGYSKHLYYCIASCKRTNPNINIFLVSDKPYKKLENISTFVNIKNIEDEQSLLFENSYIHLGKGDYNFEMFCIKRWFLYRNIIKKYGLTNTFCMDSDIMLFSDLQQALKPFDKYKISLMMTYGTSMNVVDCSILDEFCDFLITLYNDEKEFAKLKQIYSDGKAGIGNTISDMTLSNMFFANYKNQNYIGNLGLVYNNSMFDYNITTTRFLDRDAKGYKILNKQYFDSISKSKYIIKNIIFDNNGHAYCKYKDGFGNELGNIYFHSIHFTVWSKIFMANAFAYKEIKLNDTFINIYREYKVFKSKIKKIIKKI